MHIQPIRVLSISISLSFKLIMQHKEQISTSILSRVLILFFFEILFISTTMTLVRIFSRQLLCNLNRRAVYSPTIARSPVPNCQQPRELSSSTDRTDHRGWSEQGPRKSRNLSKYLAAVPMLLFGLVEFASCEPNEESAAKCTLLVCFTNFLSTQQQKVSFCFIYLFFILNAEP